MEISYDSSDIRLICEDELVAEQTYGVYFAEQLYNRLADLSAATNLEDVIAGKLRAESNNSFTISLSENSSMNFEAINRTLKFGQGGIVKLNSVTRIKITSINSLNTSL